MLEEKRNTHTYAHMQKETTFFPLFMYYTTKYILRNNIYYPGIKFMFHSFIQGTKATFEGDNNHFLYFYNKQLRNNTYYPKTNYNAIQSLF